MERARMSVGVAMSVSYLGTSIKACDLRKRIATGGYGFSSRLWGMALDRVTTAEAVLANGTIVTASKDVNPDLFFVRPFGNLPSISLNLYI